MRRLRKVLASACNAVTVIALAIVAVSTLASTVEHILSALEQHKTLTELMKYLSLHHDRTLQAINTYVRILRLVMDMIQSHTRPTDTYYDDDEG